MISVFKYPLGEVDDLVLNLPKGAAVLSVGVQGQQMVLWAMVNTESSATDPWDVFIRGTGHPAERIDPSWFVGTVFVPPMFQFHIFAHRRST